MINHEREFCNKNNGSYECERTASHRGSHAYTIDDRAQRRWATRFSPVHHYEKMDGKWVHLV